MSAPRHHRSSSHRDRARSVCEDSAVAQIQTEAHLNDKKQMEQLLTISY